MADKLEDRYWFIQGFQKWYWIAKAQEIELERLRQTDKERYNEHEKRRNMGKL